MQKMELASVIIVGVHFVKATYRLEGDGVLVLNYYEEILKLRSAIQTGYYPGVQTIARQACLGNATSQLCALLNVCNLDLTIFKLD